MNRRRGAADLGGERVVEMERIVVAGDLGVARERRVGRALTGAKEPDKSADLEIVHPDVKRMLLQARSATEGLRALESFLRHGGRDPDMSWVEDPSSLQEPARGRDGVYPPSARRRSGR